MRDRPDKRPAPPLDSEALQRLGLFYAGRYATTRSKLAAYLRRKLRERGWSGSGQPEVDRLVERFAQLGYVDDKGFASARTASLLRRGFGERRVKEALRGAGIAEEDSAEARDISAEEALAAAHRFARRKRLGPYAGAVPDRAARDKAAAAMLRAGHPFDLVRSVLATRPEDLAEDLPEDLAEDLAEEPAEEPPAEPPEPDVP
ncbi:MAG TPA: RecX family transcriptional regulator [Allosphingosinicella sp.]|nr:RecX family transcriptional regulator [Allosphingosinicella sp.]